MAAVVGEQYNYTTLAGMGAYYSIIYLGWDGSSISPVVKNRKEFRKAVM